MELIDTAAQKLFRKSVILPTIFFGFFGISQNLSHWIGSIFRGSLSFTEPFQTPPSSFKSV